VNVIESCVGNYASDKGKDRRMDRQSRKEGRKEDVQGPRGDVKE